MLCCYHCVVDRCTATAMLLLLCCDCYTPANAPAVLLCRVPARILPILMSRSSASTAALLRTTVAATSIHAGVADNVLPQVCVCV